MASSFSIEDVRLLEKTISVRERIIDKLLTQDLPTKPREIDSFTNLLESVDRSIFAKAKIKIDETQNKVNEETKEILKDLLINLHNNAVPGDASQPSEVPVFQSQGLEIKEGELIGKTDHQDVSEFLEAR